MLQNNSQPTQPNTRPYGGTAIYSRVNFIPGYPYCCNTNGIEITVIKVMPIPHVTIIGVYRSPKVPVQRMCTALREILNTQQSTFNVFIGDFNLNWLNEGDRLPLSNLFIRDYQYRQLISHYTNDNRTCIDHIYNNLPDQHVTSQVLETYFFDHKPVCAYINSSFQV